MLPDLKPIPYSASITACTAARSSSTTDAVCPPVAELVKRAVQVYRRGGSPDSGELAIAEETSQMVGSNKSSHSGSPAMRGTKLQCAYTTAASA